MTWFERLTGFAEGGYEETKRRLQIQDERLISLVNGKSYGVGRFEMASLEDLRARARSGGGLPGRLRLSIVQGDVRLLHRRQEFSGALFQVASQFNMLEMVGPQITPEDGVTRYMYDPTQGPACAIAAGAATIYRNYFVPIGDQSGQTERRQLDGLKELGQTLSERLGVPTAALWRMRNGYAACTADGLVRISDYLGALDAQGLDELRGQLRVGIHQNVEVTDDDSELRPLVSQAFCSALPISYSAHPHAPWKAFASLVLEAAYEATLWEAVCNAQRGASKIVLLTRLGGGAFGNDGRWIDAAMLRALRLVADSDLDVRVVTNSSGAEVKKLLEAFY